MKRTILIADDQKTIADTLTLIFRNEGYAALATYSLEELEQLTSGLRPDLILLDVFFGQRSSLDLACRLRDERGCRVMLLSGQTATEDELRRLEQQGCAVFPLIAKPIHPTELLHKVAEAMEPLTERPARKAA
jgi:DNA-binding response OmpR family regulator